MTGEPEKGGATEATGRACLMQLASPESEDALQTSEMRAENLHQSYDPCDNCSLELARPI